MTTSTGLSFFARIVYAHCQERHRLTRCGCCESGLDSAEENMAFSLADGRNIAFCPACTPYVFAGDQTDAFVWKPYQQLGWNGRPLNDPGCSSCGWHARSYVHCDSLGLESGYLFCSPECVCNYFTPDRDWLLELPKWWFEERYVPSAEEDASPSDVSEPPLRVRDRRHKPRA